MPDLHWAQFTPCQFTGDRTMQQFSSLFLLLFLFFLCSSSSSSKTRNVLSRRHILGKYVPILMEFPTLWVFVVDLSRALSVGNSVRITTQSCYRECIFQGLFGTKPRSETHPLCAHPSVDFFGLWVQVVAMCVFLWCMLLVGSIGRSVRIRAQLEYNIFEPNALSVEAGLFTNFVLIFVERWLYGEC